MRVTRQWVNLENVHKPNRVWYWFTTSDWRVFAINGDGSIVETESLPNNDKIATLERGEHPEWEFVPWP